MSKNALYLPILLAASVGFACGGGQHTDVDATPDRPDGALLLADAGEPAPDATPTDATPPDTMPAPDAPPMASACGQPDSWRPMSQADAPSGRYWQGAVWTGTEVMIWGGVADNGYQNTGALYNPSTDTWRPVTPAGAPSGRLDMVMAWTGTEVLVWGGRAGGGSGYQDGARYNPATDTWTPMSTVSAPPPTAEPQGVWTGTELIVWGDDTTAGARYHPGLDSWTMMSQVGAPTPRDRYVMVWGDGELMVWGGRACGGGMCPYVDTGARYDPVADSWTATSTQAAPTGASWSSGVWTGNEFIVFGGRTCGTVQGCEVNDSGRYSPMTDTWTALTTAGAPSPRHNHTGVWTGDRMLIWGGGGSMLDTGALYDPTADTWTATTQVDAPSGRRLHTGIWTDAGLIIWGGTTEADNTASDGAVYCPARR